MFNQNKTYFKTVLIIKILATDVLHMYEPWRKFSAYTCELAFGGHPRTVAPPSGRSSSPGCTTCWPAPSSTRPGLSPGSVLSHNPATMTHRNIFLSEIQISQCHSSHFLLTRLYLDEVCEIYNFTFCLYTYITVIYQNVYDEFDVIDVNNLRFPLKRQQFFYVSCDMNILITVVC